MYEWIVHQGFEPIIIATKADKLNKSQLPKAIKLIRQTLNMPEDELLIPYSAVTKKGREEIYDIINDRM
jgi:GTP-binding protein